MPSQLFHMLRKKVATESMRLLRQNHVLGVGIGHCRNRPKIVGNPLCVKIFLDSAYRSRKSSVVLPETLKLVSGDHVPVELEYMEQGWAPPLHGPESLPIKHAIRAP